MSGAWPAAGKRSDAVTGQRKPDDNPFALIAAAMARPHPIAKPSVNLTAIPTQPGPRVSRIRRDPPPAVKEAVAVDPEEREQWAVIVGILTFALAVFVLTLAFGSYSTWSPREYTVQM